MEGVNRVCIRNQKCACTLFSASFAVSVDEHRSIVERIAVHDVDGAAAAMQVHLTRAADLYRARDEK